MMSLSKVNEEISEVQKHFHNDLGQLHYFLGLEVTYTQDAMILTQYNNTKELLESLGLQSFERVTNFKIFST